MRALAAFRARAAPQALRRSAEHAWQARWWAILSVATQDALASTLVDDAPRYLHGRPPHVPTLGDLLLDAEPVLSLSRWPTRRMGGRAASPSGPTDLAAGAGARTCCQRRAGARCAEGLGEVPLRCISLTI